MILSYFEFFPSKSEGKIIKKIKQIWCPHKNIIILHTEGGGGQSVADMQEVIVFQLRSATISHVFYTLSFRSTYFDIYLQTLIKWLGMHTFIHTYTHPILTLTKKGIQFRGGCHCTFFHKEAVCSFIYTFVSSFQVIPVEQGCQIYQKYIPL